MIAKVGIAVAAVTLLVPILIAAGLSSAFSAMFGSAGSQPSATALADIPTDYLALYQRAATECPGLDWSILAAIGKVESDHGRSALPGVADGTENAFHARGPMQFLQPTFDGVLA